MMPGEAPAVRSIVASDLMNPEVLSVPEEMPAAELADFLLDNEITGAPVVDADGELAGVVSLAALVAAVCDGATEAEERSSDETEEPEISDGLEREEMSEPPGWRGLLVRDILDPEAPSVPADASVREIARKMLRERQHRVVVVEGRQVVGIVSTSDLLGLLLDED
jgi:CBS domain-containing protein